MTNTNTQPGAAPATGNTEKEQEMYAAGLEMGEANAKNNAAIRNGVPAGWKLVPIEPTETMVVCGFESRPDPVFSKPEEWEAFDAMTGCQQAAHKARLCYAAMLDASPAAPGVSTVEDKPAAYLTLDEDGSPCMLFFDVVEARAYCEVGEEPEALWRRPASTAGDAQDAVRYRSFRKALTRMDTTWLDRVGAALEALGLDPDDDVLPTAEQVDAAFDAARAALSAPRAEQGERDA
ncbi:MULTISPECIES: hypothetical protein [Achromobacter]|uniref:hypothetical protein n=1 Tax=Achromobacter TaxID=222 RepID=UPI0006BF60F9|nr:MULTISPECIES: hypothetical protein [Achromobacter]CUJ80188.1 Uncharacterised protein [Achromobacter sp. 2789STDY5608628]